MALANVALTNTFDEWRTRTNQLVIQGEQVNASVTDLYTKVGNSPSYAFANNIGVQANSFASVSIASNNIVVGAGANAYARLVGAGSNNYLLSVISGANTAVGTGANAYAAALAITVGAGANVYAAAVGAGSNAYATAVGAGSNAYMIAVQNGSNTAVGTGANAYAAALAITVGAGANVYAAAVGAGSNARSTAIGAAANTNASDASYLSTGTVAIARGGTNSTASPTDGGIAYGTGTAYAFTAVGSNGQILMSGGTNPPLWQSKIITLETKTTSGLNTYDFTTGIPSWVRRVTLIFKDVYTASLTNLPEILVQLGTQAGGFLATGYSSYSQSVLSDTSIAEVTDTTGFIAYLSTNATGYKGTMSLTNITGNDWMQTHILSRSVSAIHGSGYVSLSNPLYSLRITLTSLSTTFAGGSITVIYE